MLALALPLLLVFGGCCSNAFTFEALVAEALLTTLVTFAQCLCIAAEGYARHFSRRHPHRLFVRPTAIPVRVWVVSVVLFFASSNLNNAVFRWGVSVPVHIVARSSSTAVTMAVGFVCGKRYCRRQVVGTLALTCGAAVVMLSQSRPGTALPSPHFWTGIGLLALALVLGAVMGLYNEWVYRRYGPHWQEGFFYQHALSLPMYLVLAPALGREMRAAVGSGWRTPAMLVANCATQYVCVRGVSMLTGHALAVTVHVVLLLRRFASLGLSMYWFGNRLGVWGWVGVAMVGAGTAVYGSGSQAGAARERKRDARKNGRKDGRKDGRKNGKKETAGALAKKKQE